MLLCQESLKPLGEPGAALCARKEHRGCWGEIQGSSVQMNGALLSYSLEDLGARQQLLDYPC